MELDKWTLKIEFDDLKTQEEIDPEYAFPRDEVSRCIEFFLQRWQLDIEDFQDIAEWTETEITITSPTLSFFEEFLGWLCMLTSPKKLVLERNAD